MKNLKNTIRMAAASAVIPALAACGGGGGSGGGSGFPVGIVPPTTTPEPAVISSGTAAVGLPIVGGQVTMKCASGTTTTAVTENTGAWQTSARNSDYPCVIQVSGGMAGGVERTTSLYSVASGPGVSNITPLTDLIVAALSGQEPGAWFASASKGALSGAITPAGLSDALGKIKSVIATLPGKLSLPDGFDPITTGFNATKGDAVDGLLEVYGVALTTAGVTQADAGKAAASGTALTKEAFSLTAYTTPNLTAIKMGTSKNLDDTFGISIPDLNRGSYTAKASIDSDGNLSALGAGSPFNGYVSLLGNRIGQLCTANKGGMNPKMASQYVYVSSELTEVTDATELFGKNFVEYEDCASYGTSKIRADGAFIFTETASGDSNEPDLSFAQALTGNGRVDAANGSVIRGKVYKYAVGGVTTYVYLIVSTKQGTSTPVLNGETDYVVMGVSLQP
ncbi:hypothetical protein [Variovorax sp. KBS0712]|uniref:hypothetical protein n=1 Tax=Variovorax sp. KBS0712 TaxID=2578111 RepID=UPI0021B108BF|nr:hypothetical protein [Variovorax sp. KBS0712]